MNQPYQIAKTKVIEHFQLKPYATDDLLLRKIHLSRTKKTMPDFCASYLLEVFLNTDDVRFFNEYLWLTKEDLTEKAVSHFRSNIDEKGCYSYCYDEELKSCLHLEGDAITVKKKDFENTSIALIGSPFHFIAAYKKFKKLGVSVDVINVKYHQSKIHGIILNNALVTLMYKSIFGRKNYFEMNISDKKELKNIKLSKKYDIGFHKLGFIISRNLIDQFPKGLINEHWGALPLFKGRSTLEYSKLFGANLVVTNHLVRPEIDSGSILSFTRLNPKRIKRDIYLGLGKRIVHSLGLLASNRFKDLDNKQGKMFFEMHPWLLNHVNGTTSN